MNQEQVYRIPRTIPFTNLTAQEVNLIRPQLPTLADHTCRECLAYYTQLIEYVNKAGLTMVRTMKQLMFLQSYDGEDRSTTVNNLIESYVSQVKYLNQIMDSANHTLQLLMRNVDKVGLGDWLFFSHLKLHWLDLKEDMNTYITVPYIRKHVYGLST